MDPAEGERPGGLGGSRLSSAACWRSRCSPQPGSWSPTPPVRAPARGPRDRHHRALSALAIGLWSKHFMDNGDAEQDRPPRGAHLLRGPVHIVDSMFNQHAKWLETSAEVSWRTALCALADLPAQLTRVAPGPQRVQPPDPGFLDVVANKSPEVVGPVATGCEHAAGGPAGGPSRQRPRQRGRRGKQPEPQYLDPEEAVQHCAAGWIHLAVGRHRRATESRVVMACAGDVPTMETIAAVELLEDLGGVQASVVNVVDLDEAAVAAPRPPGGHRRGVRDAPPAGVPTVFAFHGDPWLIHRLTYKREPRRPARRARLRGRRAPPRRPSRHASRAQRTRPFPPRHNGYPEPAGAATQPWRRRWPTWQRREVEEHRPT
ncbi:MAG: hypothetical protein R2716_12195 [Microthrixaceae bacterium]